MTPDRLPARSRGPDRHPPVVALGNNYCAVLGESLDILDPRCQGGSDARRRAGRSADGHSSSPSLRAGRDLRVDPPRLTAWPPTAEHDRSGITQHREGLAMYFIVVKFETKPEWTDRWMDLVSGFTASHARRAGEPLVRLVAQRREPGRVRPRRGVHRRRGRAARQQRALRAGDRTCRRRWRPRQRSSAARSTATAGTRWAS